MAQATNNGSPISKGKVTGGSPNPPSAKRYASPSAKQTVGNGGAPLHPHSQAAIDALRLPNPVKHNSSRPKGV